MEERLGDEDQGFCNESGSTGLRGMGAESELRRWEWKKLEAWAPPE
jgi:hypothetical protein